MQFLSESEAKEAKEKLENQLITDPTIEAYDYSTARINWLEENKSWQEAKMNSKELSMMSGGFDSIQVMYPTDTISGKPQLVYQTKQKITMMRYIVDERKEARVLRVVKLIDDSYDKRYDGVVHSEWALDFWVYRIVSDSKEYYALSAEELPLKVCELRGMNVEMKDLAEVKRTMRLKSLSNIFFVHSFNPLVRLVSKEQLVDMTKSIEWKEFRYYLNQHPLGTINTFPEEVDLLRTAQLLSGKIDDWPMHLAVMGLPGTRKSYGYIETTASKFDENAEIIEGANSRIKALSPSFKEKPANIGYLAKCERMGWVDELGKMVEQEINKHQSAVTNVLGELNFLLDNKKRTVGSGNDNDCIVQATSKFLFATNPVKGKENLGEHIGLIDPTTMSRIVWWVQTKEEMEVVMGDQGILRVPPTPSPSINRGEGEVGFKSKDGCWGELIGRNDFLTIFDTTNSFLCELDDEQIRILTHNSINTAKDPMRSIWRPRAEHHIKLLVDGLCKVRCLFKDHKVDFKANMEDYVLARDILTKMVGSWETNLNIKDFTTGRL